MKAFLVTDLALAGRGIEVYKLLWPLYEVYKLLRPLYERTTINGSPAYILDHGKGAKLPGLASDNTTKIIQGQLSATAIQNYID